MKITIDIPDLTNEDLLDMLVLLDKEKNSMEYAREPEYRKSIAKWEKIVNQINDIVFKQLINAG